MVDRFEIITNPESFVARFPHPTTGLIWVKVQEFNFPAIEWDDFPIVIVTWWLQAVTELFLETSNESKFLFMDGPFYMKVKRVNHDNIYVRFIKRREAGEQMLLSVEVAFDDFIHEILSAAQRIKDKCDIAKWQSRDIDKLTDAYLELNRLWRKK